jgi:DNA polymerase III delta prime subunit
MPVCIPEFPHFSGNEAEQKVWQALKDQLPKNATLLHDIKITDDAGDHQIDTLVVWPGHGIAVIETKGGYIQLKSDGKWTSTDRHRVEHDITPGAQANSNYYTVKEYVEENWSQGTAKMIWLCAFPDTAITSDMHTPDLPRRRIIDKDELDQIADIFKREAHHNSLGQYATAIKCVAFVNAITGSFDPNRSFVESAYVRAQRVKELTEEQFQILNYADSLPNFLVQGPAGSGKTFIALEKARRLGQAGQKVALICFSRGLSIYLRKQTETWPLNERPAYIGTFHSLGKHLGMATSAGTEGSWWSVGYPEAMKEYLTSNKRIERFDAFVVDEAQDFDASWWDVLSLAYRTNDSKLYVFGDSAQALADRTGLRDLALIPLNLSANLRSTEPIASACGVLATSQTASSGIDGPPIRFYQCDESEAIYTADDQIDPLIDEGWNFNDIVLLTTGSRHPAQKEIADKDRDAYWHSLGVNDDTFYAHVSGFKGLESPVVVVSVNGWKEPDKTREYLYVALSRARDLLIVCGDLEKIRANAGDKIADLLEANKQN